MTKKHPGDAVEVDYKLHAEVIDVLKSCKKQLETISHPDFGAPDKLIQRVHRAISQLKGEPTPRGFDTDKIVYTNQEANLEEVEAYTNVISRGCAFPTTSS